jgi:hypothetical protein
VPFFDIGRGGKEVRTFAKPLGLTLVSLAGLLTGCSPAPPAASTTQAQAAPVSFDGVYTGQIRLTTMAAAARGQKWCETNPDWAVSVKDNAFHYTLSHPHLPQANRDLSATIAPDGTFSGATINGDVTMAGRISGSHIEGSIKGVGCSYAFAADRSG